MTTQTRDTEQPTRICNHCQNRYPINDFRLRTHNGLARMTECRLCHNQAERLRRQRRKGWLTKRQFNRYLTSLKNQRTARGVNRVYVELVQHFGGTGGLVKAWTQAIDQDMAEGGFRAHRHIAVIIRLMERYEDDQPDRPNYSTMSDEELLDRLSRAEALG
jgi:hypothetical protein